ncbi:MAG TPA: preprotein translocase subunit YajC [Gaiellaceae bacterium]|nr:preprotein translocase subunit YajC [Gaiellaceae bacterium]
MGQLIIIVAMFALLWLLLIRPQRSRLQEQRRLHAEVEVGDEILTAGGLYGHVRELGEEDDLVVEIAPGTEVRMARRAVAAIVPPEDEEDEEEMDELVEAESGAIDEIRS